MAGHSTPQRIADAAIAVVARQGLDALSVRTVARAADVAPGTVQHHFPSRSRLLDAALDRVVERQQARVAATGHHDSALAALRSGLRALLPLDDERRDESVVWLAFTAAAASSSTVAARHGEVVALMRARLADAIGLAREWGELGPDVDPARAAVLVAAVTDGLVVHGLAAGAGERDGLGRLCDDAVDRLLGVGPGRRAPSSS